MRRLGIATLVLLLLTTGAAWASPAGHTAAAATCAPTATTGRVVHLGDYGRSVQGNPSPVRVSVAAGSVVTVVARFGERKLTFPSASDTVLRGTCTRRTGWQFARRFVAARSGVATVSSHTEGCMPCVQLEFRAKVTVHAKAS